LPFPTPEGVNVDSLHPFTNELNADIVQVKGLAPGNYKLVIDTNVSGIYSNKDFKKGINMSYSRTTPQYLQSVEVLNLFLEYWKAERTLRIMKYVEYSHLSKVKNKDDLVKVKKVFDAILERSKASDNFGFFGRVFETYLTDKPKEKELESKLESLLNQIQQINKPVEHIYKIERMV
jgi:hypothetical protein